MTNDTALILLTYKRIKFFQATIDMIKLQTNKSFDLYISHYGPGSDDMSILAENTLKDSGINFIFINSEINDGCWRRHTLAKELATKGYQKIMFLDDDIAIPNNYVECAINQYEPSSYKSWWAWKMADNTNNFNNRSRILKKGVQVNYCGAGVSIIDASIFLDNEYFNLPFEEVKWIDDLWISFYADHILGWNLGYLDIPDVDFMSGHLEGALYSGIESKKLLSINYSDFLFFLKQNYGWKI
jgi:hypothetical protein